MESDGRLTPENTPLFTQTALIVLCIKLGFFLTHLPLIVNLLREHIMDEAELTVRLIMDHKEACQVLGRAGCNIKTLRDETGSKIVLSNKEYKKRVLSITDKKKQVMKAIGRLSEILESEVNSYGASSRLVPISLTLIIPKNICGIIVGKKGETIKELRVQSGAQIVLAAEVNEK